MDQVNKYVKYIESKIHKSSSNQIKNFNLDSEFLAQILSGESLNGQSMLGIGNRPILS